MEFVRGQKSKLSAFFSDLNFEVRLELTLPGTGELDFACFGVDAQGKLSDESYLIFYNQPHSPQQEIILKTSGVAGRSSFMVNLALLPQTIERLIFTASLDGNGTMAQLSQGRLAICHNGEECLSFPLNGQDYTNEKALIIAEVYRRGEWRVSAVGQGFNGGLAALLAHFGGSSEAAPPPPTPPVAASNAWSMPIPPVPAPVAQAPVTQPLTIEKAPAPVAPAPVTQPLASETAPAPVAPAPVTQPLASETAPAPVFRPLASPDPSWQLQLPTNTPAPELCISLYWKKPQITSWFSETTQIEIGALVEMADNGKYCLQSIGKSFGSNTDEPFIYLEQTPSPTANEVLHILRPASVKRLLVFIFSLQGQAAIANGAPQIEMKVGSALINVPLTTEATSPFCAALLVENQSGHWQITKQDRYFAGHLWADQHYGFGFDWHRA